MAVVASTVAALLGFCGYAGLVDREPEPTRNSPGSVTPDRVSTPTTEDPFDAVIRFCNAQNEDEDDIARCQRGYRNDDGSYNAP